MKKVVVFILLICIFIINILILGYLISRKIFINNIEIVSYDENTKILTVNIERKKSNKYLSNYECVVENNDEIISIKGEKINCELNVDIYQNPSIYLKNKYYQTDKINVLDYLKKKMDNFKFQGEKIYLAVNEKSFLEYESNSNIPGELLYDFKIADESIIKIENGYIVGLAAGKTSITEKNSNSKLEVVVTNLITDYIISENKKEVIPCNEYSKEEAKILDEYLAYKINKVGYNTRAGVVEAGRFLTLQFKYRIPYFYENGRLSDTGTHITDGEGRYYHEGLYLSDDKKSLISDTYKGPATWGCPLTNLQDDKNHGYYVGKKKPNGLDCSGFVTWAFRNGGTDPGDIGAGETPDKYQMTDTGEFVALTDEVLKKDDIRAGDLFNFWGHIALIIGVDNENYYVAESLPYLGGVVVRTYKKTKVNKTFTHVVYMDSFYTNGDGNYTAMWN